MSGFLPIEAYGVIGDLHSAALVGRNGAVDWWCPQRFDSPSVFAALLDPTAGGTWRIAPDAEWTSSQRYLPGTNVLETSFRLDAGGLLTVTDFMPVGPHRLREPSLFRRVRGVRGTVPVTMHFEPRFGYGLQPARINTRRSGVLASGGRREVLALSSPRGIPLSLGETSLTARFELSVEQTAWFVLRYDQDEVLPIEELEPDLVIDGTAQWWDRWISQMEYRGAFRQEVERSALALKLLQFEPSGAIVAAPTTSLPEWPGGERNWDYRFTWLRDSSYVLDALTSLGFGSEASAYHGFFTRVCREAGAGHLQILHCVDGSHEAGESILQHLQGYEGARPVRVGNGAADQFQLDVYGELLHTLHLGHRHRSPKEGLWFAIQRLVDWVAANWRRPDFGIWEARREPQHHVFSKVMAWCALDRAADLAERHAMPADLGAWRHEAQAIHNDVMTHGWDGERGCFVQVYGAPFLDASLLVIPKIRFLPRTDPRVRSSLIRIHRELSAGPEELIYRYRAPDGLSGDEGAFLVCSFWVAQNYALVGEVEEAERLFRLLLRRAGPLGLYPEEIDPRTGGFLGNFPLGLSHAAVINTAVILDRLGAEERKSVTTVGS